MTYRGAHIDDFIEAFRRFDVSEYPADWALIAGYRRAIPDSIADDCYVVSAYKRDICPTAETKLALELARMIEKHEQPPIDPDEQLAQDTALRHGFPPNGDCFVAILDAIKQVRANAL